MSVQKFTFKAKSSNFAKIPGSPIAYWVGEKVAEIWQGCKTLGRLCVTKKGLATSDNNRFLRMWHEVSLSNISFNCQSNEETKSIRCKWYPINKGGAYRKWYGNNDYVIN